jgi:hypothetical protein
MQTVIDTLFLLACFAVVVILYMHYWEQRKWRLTREAKDKFYRHKPLTEGTTKSNTKEIKYAELRGDPPSKGR